MINQILGKIESCNSIERMSNMKVKEQLLNSTMVVDRIFFRGGGHFFKNFQKNSKIFKKFSKKIQKIFENF